MLYSVSALYTTEYRAPAQIETWDEVIIQTTPALRWAVGQSLLYFMKQSKFKGFRVDVLIDQRKRSKSLGTKIIARIPSDSEVAQRTSSGEIT